MRDSDSVVLAVAPVMTMDEVSSLSWWYLWLELAAIAPAACCLWPYILYRAMDAKHLLSALCLSTCIIVYILSYAYHYIIIYVLYIYTHIYIYIHIYTYIHAYICVYIYFYISVSSPVNRAIFIGLRVHP